MVLSNPCTVASGVPHRVLGASAGQISDLQALGDCAWFAVDLRGQEYRVCGEGCRHGDEVRFYEKTDEGLGKDVRVWTIRPAPDGAGLVAVP